jgi:hypothetical protein
MIKKNLIGTAIALALGFTGAAHAFTVNPGTGSIGNVGGFDWAPGSALGVNSLPLPVLATDTPSTKNFTVYSQASLSSYLNTGNGTISDANLNTNYEVTYVLGFGETGTLTSNIPTGPFAGAQAQFVFDPTGLVNYFQVFYDTSVNANALTGTGYNDGQLILAGTVVNDNGSNVTGGNFNISFIAPGLLDQNGAADPSWAGQLSYTGSGSNTAIIDLNAQNQDYAFFSGLDITSLTALTILDSNAKTPFTTVDPAHHVGGTLAGKNPLANFNPLLENIANPNGDASCTGAIDGTPGTTQKDCDFLFQNDGAQKLSTAVPEAGTLGLMGLGLLGMGLARRKQSI